MRIEGKSFLVVGGAGLIGSHVVEQLLESGATRVIVYDNLCRGSLRNLEGSLQDDRLEVFSDGSDILHYDTLARAMQGIDGVFHLAAVWLLQCHEYPHTAFEVNIRGTFNVIMAALEKKVGRVVFSSSASVYGNAVETPMTEAHPYNNYTMYGASKIAGEHLFKSLGHRYGLDWVGLRYMNVYGPRQDHKGAYVAVMHKILDCIENGEAPVVFGDGSQTYDFVHVVDVARANLLAMRAEVSAECYNVGRGVGTSIKELAELLLRLKKGDLTIEYRQEGQTFVSQRVGCPVAAERDLGFTWSIGLEEGMQSLIDWRDAQRDRA